MYADIIYMDGWMLQNVVKKFLFDGTETLGSKTFLDYFPEYQCEDGTVNSRRSVMGKCFESRPWNSKGEFTSHRDY